MMNRLLVLLAAVCFGTTGTAQALGAPDAAPVTVGAARILVGAVGLQIAYRVLSPGGPFPWPRSGRLWLGALAVAAYQPTFFLAVRSTGVAVGTVVALGSAPLITGLLAWVLGRGRPGRRWLTATAVATAGLAILTLGPGLVAATPDESPIHPTGVLLALGAGASYAVYTLVTKEELLAGAGAERTMAAVFSAGALLLAPAFVILPTSWLTTPAGLLTAAWLGLVPTTVAYVLFARGLRGVTAAEASTLTLAEPLAAATLGVLLLDETLTWPVAVGGLFLMVGLALTTRPERRTEARATAFSPPLRSVP